MSNKGFLMQYLISSVSYFINIFVSKMSRTSVEPSKNYLLEQLHSKFKLKYAENQPNC